MALPSNKAEFERVATRICTGCKQSVPAWAETCQFCGAPLTKEAASTMALSIRRGGKEAPRPRASISTLTLFYISAGWWILSGVFEASRLNYSLAGAAASQASGLNYTGIAAGSLTALFGLLLFVDWPVIRRSTSSVAGLRLLLQMGLAAGVLFGRLHTGLPLALFMWLSLVNAASSLVLVWAAPSVVEKD